MSNIQIENLDCPHCKTKHEDIDEWAVKPHRTHLCLNCGMLFEGKLLGEDGRPIKAVSHPRFTKPVSMSSRATSPPAGDSGFVG